MTEIAAIETLFEQQVLSDESILSVLEDETEDASTQYIYKRALDNDDYDLENTIQLIVKLKESQDVLCGGTEVKQQFTVDVIVTVDNDESTEGEKSNALRDLMLQVIRLVRSELGKTWQGAVTLYRPPAESPEVQKLVINQDEYLQSKITFTAEHRVAA